jgi:PAS domain S-box-containing protein
MAESEVLLEPASGIPPEDALREWEDRFRQLAENINEVFWIGSPDAAQIFYVSPAYEKIWGRSCQSLYEQPLSFLEAVIPEDQSHLKAALAEETRLRQLEMEFRIIRADGALRWIRFRTFPVRNERGEVSRIVGVAEDITDRKLAEKAILDISARERRRFGQDLHDGLCQHLTGIGFMAKALEERLRELSLPETADTRQIGKLIQEAIAQTRDLAWGLSPVEADANGLMLALQKLAATTEKMFSVSCLFECGSPVLIQDHDVATHLYRICQEAVTNAIKHGKAQQVVITLTQQDHTIHLRVRDNGTGFPEVLENQQGMGLRIMNYRARMIRGSLVIQREGLSGTLVTCSVPAEIHR